MVIVKNMIMKKQSRLKYSIYLRTYKGYENHVTSLQQNAIIEINQIKMLSKTA